MGANLPAMGYDEPRAGDALWRIVIGVAAAGARWRALIGGAAAFGAGALVLAHCAPALALSGKAIRIGSPLAVAGPPAVAVDSTGTAYIAWVNNKNSPNAVQWCVLPLAAVGCSHTGALAPADASSQTVVDGVQVLLDGATVLVLADVYGTTAGSTGDYEPEQEWQSTDHGASFSAVNGGRSVADGIINADTAPLGAVLLPGTNALGYGWNTAGGSPPTFAAFPVSAPTECSGATAPRCPYASLAPATQADQIGNAGGAFASEFGSEPGVLGIFNTDFTSGNLACSSTVTVPFGTAFAYGTGEQSATNSYGVSPGQPNSAWKVAVAEADCNVDEPAVAGGQSGFGVLEYNELTSRTVYHPFDAAHMSFDAQQVLITRQSELFPSLSQDAAGGIYATFLGDGSGGPVVLAYSGSGGATWLGPVTLHPDADGSVTNVSSSVGSTGHGWVTWTDNGSVYAQQFIAADAGVPVLLGSSGKSTSTSITVSVTCLALPCPITVTLTAGHVRPVTLGTAKFTLHHSGAYKLAVKLTASGRNVVAADKGRLTASLTVSDRIKPQTLTASRSIKITPSK